MNRALNGERSKTEALAALRKQLPEAWAVAVEAQIGAETLRNKNTVGSNVLPLSGERNTLVWVHRACATEVQCHRDRLSEGLRLLSWVEEVATTRVPEETTVSKANDRNSVVGHGWAYASASMLAQTEHT